MVTFFLTCFAANKWVIKKLDKIRINFLWNADKECSGGKCFVNWKKCCSPKNLGGLGVKDIECFNCALRLHWAWLEWSSDPRPWHGTPIPCDQTDRQLLSACTKITLGDGQRASFWKDRWLQGMAPSSMAPGQFALARRKNLSVKDALNGNRWMKGLQRINNELLIDQFIQLWELIQPLILTNLPDAIT